MLTLLRITLHYSLYFLNLPPVNLCAPYSPRTPFHDLRIILCLFLSIFISLSPSLLQTQFPIIFTSPMQSLPLLSAPPLTLPLSPSTPHPPLVPLIVLLSAEGYSCLQGYENVRKAHSIFSYVNSHFPPEQTHFPRV